MSYQKQLKKAKRKQMALEKQKRADRRNAGTGQSGGSTWKTVLGLIVGTYLVIQFNASPDATTIVGLLP
jgi:hypothetical protein